MESYGYVRVSSTSQNIERQMQEMYKLGLNDNQIFIDKQSGKDFERGEYQKLVKILKKGDLLFIKSIDRLGRNYKMIIEEWARITKQIEANILVIDMPLLDTRQQGENLVGRFISDIVLQILSFVAENERDNIKSRQAEGIRIAKEKGIKLGRPKLLIDSSFLELVKKQKLGQLTPSKAIKQSNLSRSSYYKYSKLFIKENTNDK